MPFHHNRTTVERYLAAHPLSHDLPQNSLGLAEMILTFDTSENSLSALIVKFTRFLINLPIEMAADCLVRSRTGNPLERGSQC
jgi:hypothetical protein